MKLLCGLLLFSFHCAMAQTQPLTQELTQINQSFAQFQTCFNQDKTIKFDLDPTHETLFQNKVTVINWFTKKIKSYQSALKTKRYGSAMNLHDEIKTAIGNLYLVTKSNKKCIDLFHDEMAILLTLHFDRYFKSLTQEIDKLTLESCTVFHVWGHGDDISHIIESALKTNPNAAIVGQGCDLPKSSTGSIAHMRNQEDGSNGSWMDEVELGSNGYLNPQLTAIPNEPVDKKESAEELEISKKAEELKKIFPKKVREEEDDYEDRLQMKVKTKINGTGFMRLTEHNWAAAILHSEKMMEQSCGSVQVEFLCDSEGEMTTDMLKARIRHANQNFILKDSSGKQIGFQQKLCGYDADQKPVYNIPDSCSTPTGEVYQIKLDRSSFEKLVHGPCKSKFEEVRKYEPH